MNSLARIGWPRQRRYLFELSRLKPAFTGLTTNSHFGDSMKTTDTTPTRAARIEAVLAGSHTIARYIAHSLETSS